MMEGSRSNTDKGRQDLLAFQSTTPKTNMANTLRELVCPLEPFQMTRWRLLAVGTKRAGWFLYRHVTLAPTAFAKEATTVKSNKHRYLVELRSNSLQKFWFFLYNINGSNKPVTGTKLRRG